MTSLFCIKKIKKGFGFYLGVFNTTFNFVDNHNDYLIKIK